MIEVVIDTHGLLSSIPRSGPTRWLYDAFVTGEFTWVFSNEILSEYAEMIGHHYSPRAMELVLSTLLTAENTRRFEPVYRWQLIKADPDDNKFVDCALGANAFCLVTDDRHIQALRRRKQPFPDLKLYTFSQFRRVLGR